MTTTSGVGAKFAELERARRDVAHFAALAEQYPTSARTAAALDDARGWVRRVEEYLRLAGWTEKPE